MIQPGTSIDAHSLNIKELYAKLETSKEGISTEEAQKRQAVYPPNEIVGKKPPTLVEIFLDQFKDILILILIVAAIISVVISHREGITGIGKFTDAIVIMIILLINAAFGTRQEWKADKAIQALQSMTALTTHVVREGELLEILTRELVPGDVIRVESGAIIPADARIIEAVNLKCVEAALTGESTEVHKFAMRVFEANTPVHDQTNMLFSGTHVSSGRGIAVVTETGMETQFGKIADLVSGVISEQTPIQERLDHLGTQLGQVTIAICLAVIFLGIAAGGDVAEMFLMGVSLAVAAIPEGLPIVVTLAMALGVQKMAKRHAIVRKLPAVESLGAASIICTDKTGTLTLNKMTVRRVAVFSNESTFKTDIPEDITTQSTELDRLFHSAVLCNNASLKFDENGENGNEIGDPTETALLRVANNVGYNLKEIDQQYLLRDELPFDSERKRMTTVHENISNNEFHSFTKGAPDILLDMCEYYLANGEITELTQEMKVQIIGTMEQMADDALRVLAFAFKPMDKDTPVWNILEMEIGLVFIGLMGLIDPPKPEVYEAVAMCKAAGVSIKMVTGDHRRTAAAIGRELNISSDPDGVVTGKELDKLTDEEFSESVLNYSIFARISPTHKLRIVQAIKANDRIVGMTGDGVNDAPALKAADIGIAMGIQGTDVTKETSDIVLADDNFATIAAAIEEGRAVYQSMGKFLKYMLSTNSAEILVIVGAILLGLPPPFVPIQILWINLVTDGLPALALGVDPAEPGLMDRPPRNPKEHILSKRMAFFIIRISVYMTFISLSVYGATIDLSFDSFNTSYDESKQIMATTLTFATVSIIQLFNSFSCRSDRHSILNREFFANRPLVYATAISAFAQIVVIQGDQWISNLFNIDFVFFTEIFDVTALSFVNWVMVFTLSSSIILFEEIFKFYFRNRPESALARL
ncbi:MAG: cation-translocating P-type ATPase [Candidatus Kariarchaeaceae archaeon]